MSVPILAVCLLGAARPTPDISSDIAGSRVCLSDARLDGTFTRTFYRGGLTTVYHSCTI